MRVRQGVKAVAKTHFLPMQVADTANIPDFRRAAPRAIVLQPPVDMVRMIIIHCHVIELRQGQVANEAPGLAAVLRNGDAAIIADNQMPGIVRVDPEGMVINVDGIGWFATGDHRICSKRLAPIDRDAQHGGNVIDRFRVLRISRDLVVVKWPNGYIVLLIGPGPADASIRGTQHGAFFRLHQRIDPPRLGGRRRNGDSPEFTFWQAVIFGLPRPAGPAIPGYVHAGPGRRT